MLKKSPPNILIVGAGPTGLTAALGLFQLGLKPRIIDRRKQGSGLSRAVGILPSSLEILHSCGVSAELQKAGVMLTSARVFNADKPLAAFSLETEKPGNNGMLSLAQDKTEAIMRQAIEALGGRVEFATTLESLSQDNKQVTCQLTVDGKTRQHDFDHVVAADGIHSTVRNALGLDFPGFDLPETWSIADIEVADWRWPNSFCAFRLSGGKVVVAVPMEPNRLRVVADRPNALSQLPIPVLVTNIRREGDFTISIRQMEQYSHGRIVFAGDAAHAHSPVGGQGMNLGIGDAGEIASRLAADTIANYGPARHMMGKNVITNTERIRKIMTSPNGAVRFASGQILRTVSKIGWLRRAALNRNLYAQSQ